MTDIHHQGFAPGRMSGHGEHGEEENRRLREDVEILKRATAFFAKETR